MNIMGEVMPQSSVLTTDTEVIGGGSLSIIYMGGKKCG
jgi:hypothetical protein